MITASTVAKFIRFAKKVVTVGLFLLVGIILFALFCDRHVASGQKDRIFSSIDSVPYRPVALVLGTTYRVQGRPNPFYDNRLKAVAELYRQNKISHILVSGDNATLSYNEPITMHNDLVDMGIPSEAITMDYAGFRTLDSVVRAQKVFGLEHFVVVSQRFHSLRALFLARENGIDAVAFEAPGVGGYGGLRTRGREVLARTKAVLDVYVLGTQPKFLGEQEEISIFERP